MAEDAPESVSRLARFSIGDWIVDPRTCRLTSGDVVRRIRPQLMGLLVCLARRPGDLVLKEEILADVWPGQSIAYSGLTRCIAELRQVLDDDAHQPRYIEATRKRGYRLIAPVVGLTPPVEETAPAETGGVGCPDRTAAVTDAAPIAGSRRSLRRIFLWVVPIALSVVIAGLVVLPRSPAAVLTEQDMVLLAFENLTGDAVFDETIPLAMSIQLEQSPYLALLSAEHVRETLLMMQRPADTPITPAIGLDLCERVGARAVIVTSIAELGSRYAIGIEAIECNPARHALVRRQEIIETREQVLEGLERGAEAIRKAVGESAASVERYGTPAVQATTASLDALRALRRGDVARDLGQGSAALDHYRQAVLLDPDFALAHLRRGNGPASGQRFKAAGGPAGRTRPVRGPGTTRDQARGVRAGDCFDRRPRVRVFVHAGRAGVLLHQESYRRRPDGDHGLAPGQRHMDASRDRREAPGGHRRPARTHPERLDRSRRRDEGISEKAQ